MAPAILSVDDDLGSREVVLWALTLAGMDVRTVDSAMEALAAARERRFQLMLIDQRLPDIDGTQLIRIMRSEGVISPFLLVSGFLTTAITVEAMKLGAIDVLEKPVDVDDLVPVVCNALEHQYSVEQPNVRHHAPPAVAHRDGRGTDDMRPGSAAERWALHVLKAAESPKDLKTIEDWAECVGVSYTSLRESCHVLGIPAREARDLMRVLRAVIKSRRHHCSPEVLLDVSDGRTLEKLLRQAGLTGEAAHRATPHQFLRDQHFVPRDNAGVRILLLRLAQQQRVRAW
jgi:DNA-binding response OmpR family regulator